MTASEAAPETTQSRLAFGRGVLVKAPVAVVVGGVTWWLSEYIQDRISDTEWIISLQFSLLVGGITFIVQYLVQFERRVESLEKAQASWLDEVRQSFEVAASSRTAHQEHVQAILEDNFAKISRATGIFAHMEGSPFSEEDFEKFFRDANRLGAETPPLLRELVGREIRRMSETVQQIGTSRTTHYDGEDREWLLALARSATQSIDAVSLSIADASGYGFDGGFWTSDLGERYLGLQAEAITRRGVAVRRVFITDPEWSRDDPAFLTILRRHEVKGVEVRVLDWATIPEERREDVTDFIVFDGALTYELGASQFGPREKRATLGREHPARTARIRTELHWDELVVSEKQAMLDFLWSIAEPPIPLRGAALDVRDGAGDGGPRQPPTNA